MAGPSQTLDRFGSGDRGRRAKRCNVQFDHAAFLRTQRRDSKVHSTLSPRLPQVHVAVGAFNASSKEEKVVARACLDCGQSGLVWTLGLVSDSGIALPPLKSPDGACGIGYGAVGHSTTVPLQGMPPLCAAVHYEAVF